jgi:autotransporter-associated beta strand protein
MKTNQHFLRRCLFVVLLCGVTSSFAANVFWDVNGATAGTGATPNGTWDGVNVFWSTTSAGNAAPGLTTVGSANDGFFSAGTDATGIYNVTVSGTQLANSLTFQEGTPTLTGGVITLTRTASSSGNIGSLIASSSLNGTATVASGVQLDTASGANALLKLVANDSASTALELKLSGPITTTAVASNYNIRLGGAGNGRIESSLASGSVLLGDIQGLAVSPAWAGVWTIAGNQSLGSASVAFSASTTHGAGARIILGDSLADVQSLDSINVNNATPTNAVVIKSTATLAGGLAAGSTLVQIPGSLTAATLTVGTSGTVMISDGTTAGSATLGSIPSTAAGGKIVGGAAANSTLIVSNSSSGVITNTTLGGAGANENKLAVSKTGSGTISVSGTHTYTGPTTISDGEFALDGSLNSPVTVNGTGTFAPGLGVIGIATINNTVTLAGTLSIQITGDGGVTNDVLSAPGQTINFGGTLNVTDVGTTAFTTNNTFSIFQAATRAGSFSAINLPALDFGLGWDTSQLNSLGIIKVVAAPVTSPIAGYTIQTFGDEFNGSSVDTTLWSIGDGYTVPGGRTNVSVSGGSLHLNTSKDGTNWITGWVNTKNFVHKYGVWVSRYRIAQTNGLNNAFWTATPGGNPWDDIEIDINEGHWPYGSLDTLTSHIWYHPVAGSNTFEFGAKPAYNWSQYHTNVLEWRADNTLKFYMDGVEYTNTTNGLNKAGAMAPQNLIFSTHYFDWAGPGNGLTNTSMDVDWVRVFQKPGWSGAVSGSWTNPANWGADGVPGTNFAALFNQATANTNLSLPSDRWCQSLYFDTPDAPAFTFLAGNNLHLGGNALASSRGGIILGSDLTKSQTINVAITAERELEFGNYSTTPGVTLELNGTITGTATGRNLLFGGRSVVNLNSSLPASIYDVRKFGGKELWLNAANNHTGTNYSVGGSRIMVPVNGALGVGTHSYCGFGGSGGAVLLANGVNYTSPHTIHLNDDGFYVGATQYPVFGLGDASESTFGGSIVVEKDDAPVGAMVGGGILHLTGSISGASSNSLSLIGSGTVSIEGNNTFAGPINATVGILAGNGIIRGTVTKTNGRLNPGRPAAIGTLTISNSLTLVGSFLKTTFRLNKDGGPTHDKIVGLTTLTCGGSLIVTNIGVAEPVAGDSFQLFSAASIGGAFASVTLPSLTDTNLSWNTNNLYTTGTIAVVGTSGSGTITNSYSGGVLSLSWPAGQGWRLQAQTNSLSTGLGTNWVYVTDGSVSSTNIPVNPANPTVFFRLKYP